MFTKIRRTTTVPQTVGADRQVAAGLVVDEHLETRGVVVVAGARVR